jgi:hypothetical protein
MTVTKLETDAQRESRVVAGVTAKPKRQSAATRKANATAKQPAKQQPAKQPKPVKPAEMNDRVRRNTVLSALNAAAGDLVQNWSHAQITKAQARAILSDRLRYGGAGPQWDSRLDPFAKS